MNQIAISVPQYKLLLKLFLLVQSAFMPMRVVVIDQGFLKSGYIYTILEVVESVFENSAKYSYIYAYLCNLEIL